MSEDRLDRESLLEEINRCLPAPVREETQLDGDLNLVGGDPGEVIVLIVNGFLVFNLIFKLQGNHSQSITRHGLYPQFWSSPATPDLT